MSDGDLDKYQKMLDDKHKLIKAIEGTRIPIKIKRYSVIKKAVCKGFEKGLIETKKIPTKSTKEFERELEFQVIFYIMLELESTIEWEDRELY